MSPKHAGKVDAVSRFVQEVRGAGVVLRFSDVPFMQGKLSSRKFKSILKQQGFFESVAEHSWIVGILADLVIAHYPAIGECVDESKVQKILRYHDIREIKHGDVTQYTQNKLGKNPNIAKEEKYLREITDDLPMILRKQIVKNSEVFETEDSSSPEIVFAQFIDELHGKMVVLKNRYPTSDSEFIDTSEQLIKNLIKKGIRLSDRLKLEGEKLKKAVFAQAANDVLAITKEILKKYKAAGVKTPKID